MAGKRDRRRVEVAARRRMVARLYLEKRTQAEIAALLGVGRATVSRDLSYLVEEWRERAVGDIEAVRGRELAELEQMERECVLRYLKEKKLRWMELRLKLKERKARLLALDVRNPVRWSGQKIMVKDVSEWLSREQLVALAELAERLSRGGLGGMSRSSGECDRVGLEGEAATGAFDRPAGPPALPSAQ